MIFIIHLHRAKGDKFYLRLEKDGVLKNWAISKGIPDSPGVKHLAIQIRDSDLSVAGFVGAISKGEFGPGVISIWDKGSYTPISWQQDKISFRLQGTKSPGTYFLGRFPKAGKDCWTISKIEADDRPLAPTPAPAAARPKIPAPSKRETHRPGQSQSPAPKGKISFPPKRKSRWGSGSSKSGGGRRSAATWWMG